MIRTEVHDSHIEVEASGTLTAEDYDRILPELERLADERGPLDILVRLVDLSGFEPEALWKEVKFDMSHQDDMRRVAIVGGGALEKWGTKLSKPFVDVEIEFFPSDRLHAAERWLRDDRGDDVRTVEVRGVEIPALGLGTWQMQGPECTEAVRDALALGYRHIDTAAHYENEPEVGRGLRESELPRDEIFVTTKVWWKDLEHDACIEAAHESLERLGLDHVDLLLIHWPAGEAPIEEPLRAFRQLEDEGAARHVGVSNFTPSLLERALETAPEILCDQVEYHPFLGQSKLLETCREHDVMLTAYSPLARAEVTEEPVLDGIGKRHGKTPAQVALRWLLQQDRVAAIPRAASAEHRRQNLDVFDFALSREEMTRIHALDRGERLIDPEFAPEWERSAAG